MREAVAVGARASVEHAFDVQDVSSFAQLCGDDNPIHLDADAARAAGFERAVVHGALVASLISRLLGTKLPGPGTVLLGQTLRFQRPVHPGDRLRATVEVTKVRDDKPIVTLHTWVESDEIVIDGEATVLVRDLGSA
jgi:acyl dehydratase